MTLEIATALTTPPAVATTRPKTTTDDESPTISPKNRLKFLCSHGGRILPRPNDGNLKYVGGDTRILAVPRSISFAELKKKIDSMFKTESIIKYQLSGDDLDVLVSVVCDEDIAHMLEEYDRIDATHPRSPTSTSSPRFRLFIFSYARSQARTPPDAHDAGAPLFTISATTGNSPTSSIDEPSTMIAHRFSGLPTTGGKSGMTRVRSTPNLGVAGAGASNHQQLHNFHREPNYAPMASGAQSQWRMYGGGGWCRATPARGAGGWHFPAPLPACVGCASCRHVDESAAVHQRRMSRPGSPSCGMNRNQKIFL